MCLSGLRTFNCEHPLFLKIYAPFLENLTYSSGLKVVYSSKITIPAPDSLSDATFGDRSYVLKPEAWVPSELARKGHERRLPAVITVLLDGSTSTRNDNLQMNNAQETNVTFITRGNLPSRGGPVRRLPIPQVKNGRLDPDDPIQLKKISSGGYLNPEA